MRQLIAQIATHGIAILFKNLQIMATVSSDLDSICARLAH
jgi:hypothetical protein